MHINSKLLMATYTEFSFIDWDVNEMAKQPKITSNWPHFTGLQRKQRGTAIERMFHKKVGSILILFLLTALISSGCVYIPPFSDQVRDEDMSQLTIGVSTKTELLKLLGTPNVREQGNTYIWQWKTDQGFLFVYFLGAAGTLYDEGYYALAVFDSEDILIDFKVEATKILPQSSEEKKQVASVSVVPVANLKFVRGLKNTFPAYAATLSPNGRYFAAGDRTVAGIRVWDLQGSNQSKDFEKKTYFSLNNTIFSIAFSSDSSRVFAGTVADTAVLWEVQSGAKVCEVSDEGSYTSVAISPDNNYLATGEKYTGNVTIYDANNCDVIHQLPADLVPSPNSVDFHPTKPILASFSGKIIRFWDIKTGRLITKKRISNFNEYDWTRFVLIKFSPDGKFIAINSIAHIEVWKLEIDSESLVGTDPQFISLLPYSSAIDFFAFASLSFSQDGQSLWAGTQGTIIQFELASGKRIGGYSASNNHYPFGITTNGLYLVTRDHRGWSHYDLSE